MAMMGDVDSKPADGFGAVNCPEGVMSADPPGRSMTETVMTGPNHSEIGP